MDRNLIGGINRAIDIIVALRKESVDRNRIGSRSQKPNFVALRKESVDRNRLQRSIDTISQPSLSARRAWIEIYDT